MGCSATGKKLWILRILEISTKLTHLMKCLHTTNNARVWVGIRIREQFQTQECLDKAVQWRITNYLTNSVAPETEGSSPHSQQPASGPYPEPTESTLQQPVSPRSILIPSPIYASVFRVVSFRWVFPPKPCTLFLLSHSCYKPRPPHPPWLYLPKLYTNYSFKLKITS
jgi:hypothetical protein